MMRTEQYDTRNIVEIEIEGEIHRSDMDQALATFDGLFNAFDTLRVVKIVRPCHITAGAMWDDLKWGPRHFTRYERVALVTDVHWVEQMARFFKGLMPGTVRLFRMEELDEARAWIQESADD